MRWELPTRVRMTTFCVGPSARRAISLMLLGLMISPASFAQQTGSPDQPDAPSATVENKPQAKPAAPVNLLSGKSFMFPNLAVNNKPLTPKQKFFLAANNSVAGWTFIGTAAGAGFSQAFDFKSGYGQGAEGYFKRWGAGMAFAATSNMIGTFAIASALHEDPRYFVENSGKFRESVRYAVSRVFICRRDDGSTGTNWAGILGPLGAAGVANAYWPPGSKGIADTFGNWGIALAVSAGGNALREFWPTINKKLRLPPMGVDSSPGVVKHGEPSTPPEPNPKQQ
jgi:hypothetical protein